MNVYMKARWKRRRAEVLEYLGGVCVECGSDSNLEIDHIDPATKLFTLASGSSFAHERFWAEVDKCQLLCQPHHAAKTTLENRFRQTGSTELRHGTTWMYGSKHGCRCDLCVKAQRDYRHAYRERVKCRSVPTA